MSAKVQQAEMEEHRQEGFDTAKKFGSVVRKAVFANDWKQNQDLRGDGQDGQLARFTGQAMLATFACHDEEFAFDRRSLFLFKAEWRLRNFFVWLATWKWFNFFIFLVIILNTFILATDNFEWRISPGQEKEEKEMWRLVVAQVITGVYVAELVVRVIAQGLFMAQNSYLRNGWNILDCLIVLVTVLDLLIDETDVLPIVSLLRLLKPLRSLDMLQQSKDMVNALVSAIPGLLNVLLLQFFCFFTIAILGVSMFSGSVYKSCRSTETLLFYDAVNSQELTRPVWPLAELKNDLLSSQCHLDSDCAWKVADGQPAICGSSWDKAELDPFIVDNVTDNEELLFGVPGFDNTLQGLSTIFQIVTLESWVYMMYSYNETNQHNLAYFFFPLVVVIGNFFIMNLIIAQYVDKFTEFKEQKLDAIQEKKLKRQSERNGDPDKDSEQSDDPFQVNQRNASERKEPPTKAMNRASVVSNRSGSASNSQSEKSERSVNDNLIIDEINQQEEVKSNKITISPDSLYKTESQSNGSQMRSQVLKRSQFSEKKGKTEENLPKKHAEMYVKESQADQNSARSSHEQQIADGDAAKRLAAIGSKDRAQSRGLRSDDVFRENQYEKSARKRSEANRVIRLVYKLVTSVPFNMTIMLLIIINSILMAVYSTSRSREDLPVDQIDLVFVIIFSVEILLKVIGLGPCNWFKDKINLFDTVIIFISLVDIISRPYIQSTLYLRIFRCLRLFRFLKLGHYFQSIRRLLNAAEKSVKDIVNFLALLFIFSTIFALFGQQLFAYRALVDEDDSLVYGEESIAAYIADSSQIVRYPRANFNTFGMALTSIVIVILGEDWNFVMYTWVRSVSQDPVLATLAQIYFMSLVILGNFIMMSLFTALLLRNFEDDIAQEIEDHFANKTVKKSLVPKVRKVCTQEWCIGFKNYIVLTFGRKEDVDESKLLRNQKSHDTLARSTQLFCDKDGKKILPRSLELRPLVNCPNLLHYSTSALYFSSAAGGDSMNSQQSDQPEEEDQVENMHKMSLNRCVGRSLFIFGPENCFRKLCWRVVKHKAFHILMYLTIVMSLVPMVFYSPLKEQQEQHRETYRMLALVDLVANGIFILEAVLKVIAQGFCCNYRGSYLRNPWNVFDFLIVVFAIFDTVLIALDQSQKFFFFKAMRSFEFFKPMRFVGKNKGLKIATESLIHALPSIIKMMFIILLMMLMIAILQTNMFESEFSYCFTEHLGLSLGQRLGLIKTKADCLNYGGEWFTPDLNYDSISQSLLTLFVLQSTEGWIGTMWSSADVVDVDMQPVEGNNAYFAIPYTILLMTVISLLFMNLFVGIVTEAFNKQKFLMSYNHLLKPIQRDFIQIQLLTLRAKPKKILRRLGQRAGKCRKLAMDVIKSRFFAYAVNIIIIVNILALSCESYQNSETTSSVIFYTNLSCYILMCVEFLITVTALGRNYFKNAHLVFNFFLVIIPLIFECIGLLSQQSDFKAFMVICTVARSFRLFFTIGLKRVRVLFITIFEVLPAVSSLGFLLLILIFIYAVICVQNFAFVSLVQRGYETEIGYNANFQTFTNSFLTMLRSVTGEAWPSIMFESARQSSILFQCHADEDYELMVEAKRDPNSLDGPKGCGHYYASLAIHLSFQVFVSQIFLNLFTAIFIDGFVVQSQVADLPVTDESVQAFKEEWLKLDPKGTSFISINDLPTLLVRLAYNKAGQSMLILPKQIRYGDPQVIGSYISLLQIPTHDKLKKVMFYDVMQQMCFVVIKVKRNRDRLDHRLRFINTLETQACRKQTIQSFSNLAMDVTFNVKHSKFDFEVMMSNLNRLNHRIELVNELFRRSQKLKAKYGSSVDTVESLNPANEQPQYNAYLYTTKHAISAMSIARNWLHYKKLREMKAQATGQQPQP